MYEDKHGTRYEPPPSGGQGGGEGGGAEPGVSGLIMAVEPETLLTTSRFSIPHPMTGGLPAVSLP